MDGGDTSMFKTKLRWLTKPFANDDITSIRISFDDPTLWTVQVGKWKKKFIKGKSSKITYFHYNSKRQVFVLICSDVTLRWCNYTKKYLRVIITVQIQ